MGRRGPKPVKSEAVARAALSLFVEVGVKGATTRAIARRAGTTEGSIYRHYASKEELARRLLAECLRQFAENISGALADIVGPRRRLRAFVLAYFDYARQNPLEHAYIVQSHNLHLSSVPEESMRPRRLLADLLAEGHASGEFEAADARLMAPFIAGGLGRVISMLEDRPGDFDPATVAESMCQDVERLVGVKKPPEVPATP